MSNTIYRLLAASGAALYEGTLDLQYTLPSDVVELDTASFRSSANIPDEKMILINELVTKFPTSEEFFKCLIGDDCVKIILIQPRKEINETNTYE